MEFPRRGPVAAGTSIGHWTVIAEAPKRYGLRHLKCRCVCGTERDVFIGNLRKGLSKSCGCIGFYTQRTHGMHASTEYSTWRHIQQRCYNPKNKAWDNYGGRGIRVCQEWRDSFEAFYAHVGPRPSKDLTLDRINNDGHYEPGNVRWATWQQQHANKRPKGSGNTRPRRSQIRNS